MNILIAEKLPWTKIFYQINGQFYSFSHGLGAQMTSSEWRRAPAGTQRTILGVNFTVFNTHRTGLKIETSWAMANHGTLDEHNARIKEFEHRLNNGIT